MKKIGFILLFIITTSINASSVRVNTLGSIGTKEGSLFYKDDRNIFYNPAYLNKYSSFIIISEDEAGFFTRDKNKKWHYGFNFGRDEEAFTSMSGQLSSMNNISTTNNNLLELFVSKGSWGLSLSHIKAEGKPSTSVNKESIEAMKVSFGLKGNVDFWVDYYLKHEGSDSSTTQETYKGGSKINTGLKSHFWKSTQYLTYSTDAYDYGVTATANKFSSTEMTIGISQARRIRKELTMFYGIGYSTFSSEDKLTSATTKIDKSFLPINLAIEYKLSDWFTLRAGSVFKYNYSDKTDDGTAVTESLSSPLTGPELGGTFTHKNLSVDFKYSGGFNQASSGTNGVTKLGDIAVRYRW